MDPATAAVATTAGPGIFQIFEKVLQMGPMGVVLMIWYFDKQKTDEVLRQYRDDMAEQRRMYENNVELVNRYAELAGDLKEIIALNAQTMTRLVDRIDKEVSS